MRGLKRLLTVLFLLVLAGVVVAEAAQTGDKYLEHVYIDESESVEAMVVWSDTISIRKEAGLSAGKVRTARRGETVIYQEPTLDSPEFGEDDSYLWRNCLVGDTAGWVAEDFLIEKCYFDVLEPALELYDAGELKSMRTYLEGLDRIFADIDCEIASDGRSAIVAFEGVSWSGPYTKRLYLVGEADRMVYSNYIYDYFVSDDGHYTFVLYDSVSYGWGYSPIVPYAVFNNRTGKEMLHDQVFPSSLDYIESPAPQLYHLAEFVGDSHLLVIDHDDYDILGDWTGEFYPCLKLIDMTDGDSVVLLEPDWDWLTARGTGISGGVRLSRNGNCSSSSPVIKAAVKTNLFRHCEEELVSGFGTDG